MLDVTTICGPVAPDPASGAVNIMLRSLKWRGMAQAVTDLIEQGTLALEASVPILTQQLKAEMAARLNQHPALERALHNRQS